MRLSVNPIYIYCGLHHIPKKSQKFKADRLSYLYSVIITQQRVGADNKRFDGFGCPPSTHPLSKLLGGVSNILNFENSWQYCPITSQTHSFSNRTDLYQILPSIPLTLLLCPLLMMTKIFSSFTSAIIAIYIYISL